MGDVVRLPCITTVPLEPDFVLDAAKGCCTYVLVLGWTPEGELYCSSSDSDMREATWAMDKFRHKLLSGELETQG